jgi:hypothetical protein
VSRHQSCDRFPRTSTLKPIASPLHPIRTSAYRRPPPNTEKAGTLQLGGSVKP